MNKKREIDIDRIRNLYASGKSMREIVDITGVKINMIHDRLREVGVDTSRNLYFYRAKLRKYSIDDTLFENIDEQEKSYILGYLYADGTMLSGVKQIRLKLQEKDKEILDKINKYLNYSKPLLIEYPNNSTQCQYSLIICNSKIYDDLLKLGLTPKKSFTCKFPILTKEMIPHFIRGYFDGDGSIYVGKDRFGYIHSDIKIMGSTDFLEHIKNILLENNISSYIDHDKRVKEGVDNLRIRKIDHIVNFCTFIYKDSTILLNRKHQKFLSLIKEREIK